MYMILNQSISGKFIPLIILSLILFRHPGFTQNNGSSKSQVKVTIRSSYHQFAEYAEIRVNVTARIDRKRQPVPGVSLDIYSITDTSDVFIGSLPTDDGGSAILEIDKEIKYFKNPAGEKEFLVRFDGDDRYKSGSNKVRVRDALLAIDFIEVDSVKTILATAYEINIDGEKTPIENEDIYFYTPGSFSLLNLGEEELEDGQCMINFPVTLPGDSVGNVTIIARIEDSDDFGSVEIQKIKDWGTPRIPVIIESRRGLGDTDAPLWMVYTLIVLLSVVWFHYMYILYVVYLIKKDGKKTVNSI
ncbi:hypothetical protein ACFLU5_00875 [Bacteroidota bacterium]